MASFHLCHCKAGLQSQNLAPLTSNPTNHTALISNLLPHKPNSIKFNKLELKSTPTRRAHHIFNTLPKSPENSSSTVHEPPLKIGIVGFGNFGQFIAKALRRQGHTVLATSRSDYSEYCQQHGIEFFQDINGFCTEQPDVIVVCSSILSTESVLRGIPLQKLKSDTIFADVLSVKQFPRNLFLEVLPPEFGIVCTHPMFGPESGKNSWAGLPFVYDKVRIAENSIQDRKCAQFLSIFEEEGCRMVEMSCEEHDRHAAGSQFITHTIGRILSHLDLESTPINTKGYETLLQLTENTVSDSFDLYYGLFMYNVNATEQIENLDRAFETVKQKLFGRLHDILRKQIVERVPMQGVVPSKATREVGHTPYFLPNSERMTDLASFAMPPPPQPQQSKDEAVSTPKEARVAASRVA
ncbi:arogenate dehydrogenase 2, chloroplastic-like [Magnolia sinica]|uniref:arogenate dehydrogenase 2, chloroplastic-like n=1 Tax=Magnolia sinica TaxID=86752 RepID=UPI00265B0EBA|nr:arogenate dehydrogenase 2, chloroplastic-like [Magnolia sinica]